MRSAVPSPPIGFWQFPGLGFRVKDPNKTQQYNNPYHRDPRNVSPNIGKCPFRGSGFKMHLEVDGTC